MQFSIFHERISLGSRVSGRPLAWGSIVHASRGSCTSVRNFNREALSADDAHERLPGPLSSPTLRTEFVKPSRVETAAARAETVVERWEADAPQHQSVSKSDAVRPLCADREPSRAGKSGCSRSVDARADRGWSRARCQHAR